MFEFDQFFSELETLFLAVMFCHCSFHQGSHEHELLNSFVPNPPFLYPLKTSENLSVFREQRKGALRTNVLIVVFYKNVVFTFMALGIIWCYVTYHAKKRLGPEHVTKMYFLQFSGYVFQHALL